MSLFGAPGQSPPVTEEAPALPVEFERMQTAVDEAKAGLAQIEQAHRAIASDPNISEKRKAELKAELQAKEFGFRQKLIDDLIRRYETNLSHLDSALLAKKIKAETVGSPLDTQKLLYHQNRLVNGSLRNFSGVRAVAEWYEHASPEERRALQEHRHLVADTFKGQQHQHNVQLLTEQLKADLEASTANPELEQAYAFKEAFVMRFGSALWHTVKTLDGPDRFAGPFQSNNRTRVEKYWRPGNVEVGQQKVKWQEGIFG